MTVKSYNNGQYETIHRTDGKIVLTGKETYDHIGMHAEIGTGSVFAGGITPKMIQDELLAVNIPESGGGVPANFPGGGYLLVAPFEEAMKLQDASLGTATKEDRGQPVPVTAVHTTQPLSDFATDVTTMLVFPYNPQFSDDKTNDFVDGEPDLAQALEGGKLYVLATAFPGGFSVDALAEKSSNKITFPKQEVPRSVEWGGTENPTWAVIIPNSTGNPVVERWNRLAGV